MKYKIYFLLLILFSCSVSNEKDYIGDLGDYFDGNIKCSIGHELGSKKGSYYEITILNSTVVKKYSEKGFIPYQRAAYFF